MKWKQTINIRPILNNDDTSLAEKARLMKEILLVSPFVENESNNKMLTFITKILDEAGKMEEELGETEAVELFDDGLKYLYDWADINRVWLGI